MQRETRIEPGSQNLSDVEMTTIAPVLTKDRLDGIIIGIALGDSLGVPVETMTQEEIATRFGAVREFLDPNINEYFTEKGLPRGTWSDDTQLSIAIFRSIIAAGGYSQTEVAKGFVEAFHESTRGWGGTTVKGAEALLAGFSPDQAEFQQMLGPGTGNGIPMKVAGLATWAYVRGLEIEDLVEPVSDVCAMSHRNSLSASAGLAHVAGLLYCLANTAESFSTQKFLDQVIHASELGRHCFPGTKTADDMTDRLGLLRNIHEMSERDIISLFSGGGCYVYDSFPFSYAFFLKAPGSIDSFYNVINAGGDTDSNGAIVGALQGALLGRGHFPEKLVLQVQSIEQLLKVSNSFLRAFGGSSSNPSEMR